MFGIIRIMNPITRLGFMVGWSLLVSISIVGCQENVNHSHLSPSSKDDRLLEVSIKDAFRRSPHVPGHAITVKAKEGHIQLFGLVENKVQAEQAELIALENPNVTSVENQIRLR